MSFERGIPTVRVSLLDAASERAWDEFVRATPDGTFFHLSGWRRVIEKTFGHRTFYLLARRADAVVGVLPLTQVKSFAFGNSLIGNAFGVYGGILSADAEAFAALEGEAIGIARRENVDCLEFRSTKPAHDGWARKENLYATFRRAISGDPGANLNAIPRKQRAMVRKGIANGLKSEYDDDVERLHHIYASSVRNLGTPVFSKGYFRRLREEFGQSCDVVTVVHGSTPVASVLNFYFRDEVLPYYGGGLTEARDLAANDFMYWEVMRRACERGCRLFDFGRSKVGTGAYNFKRYWGFEPKPLTYEFLLVRAKKVPELNPLNPKFRTFIALWRHLPLPVTKLLGPPIVRGLG
jgi:FemAB-related protein (PEP-CTERM system-associated)